MKKLSDKLFSDKLLYVKSKYSNTGQLPNPLGNVDKRFILGNKHVDLQQTAHTGIDMKSIVSKNKESKKLKKIHSIP